MAHAHQRIAALEAELKRHQDHGSYMKVVERLREAQAENAALRAEKELLTLERNGLRAEMVRMGDEARTHLGHIAALRAEAERLREWLDIALEYTAALQPPASTAGLAEEAPVAGVGYGWSDRCDTPLDGPCACGATHRAAPVAVPAAGCPACGGFSAVGDHSRCVVIWQDEPKTADAWFAPRKPTTEPVAATVAGCETCWLKGRQCSACKPTTEGG